MKLDLQNLNPFTTFYVDENKPDDASIDLRVCSGEILRNIQKQTRKKMVEYVRGQRYEFEKIDHELENSMIWDYCIGGWRGIVDANDDPIPCTRENKVALMLGSPLFSGLVMGFLKDLEVAEAAHEKKSGTT